MHACTHVWIYHISADVCQRVCFCMCVYIYIYIHLYTYTLHSKLEAATLTSSNPLIAALAKACETWRRDAEPTEDPFRLETALEIASFF